MLVACECPTCSAVLIHFVGFLFLVKGVIQEALRLVYSQVYNQPRGNNSSFSPQITALTESLSF